MNKKILSETIIIASILFLGLFLAACQGPSKPIADDSGATAEGVSSVVNANNQFAFNMYSELAKGNGGNIFFSPYSISTAFAMVYEGARGQTAEEMQQVFRFPADENVRRPAFASVYNHLNSGSKDYQLSTANALWTHKDYTFLPEYLGTVEKYYGGKATNLDFVMETEKSRKIINDWVEKQTNDKIKDIIPPAFLSPMSRLVLTNAIYFKGNWEWEFDKAYTAERDFKITVTNIIKTPMMYMDPEKTTFNYADAGDLQILELPYKGEEISMLILLPTENLESIEPSLNSEKIKELKEEMQETKLDAIYLPKFEFDTKYFMEGQLSSLGMPLAFSWPGADFSGMDGTKMLYIGGVIHQAFVKVDEKGTEAAAATVIGMKVGAGMPRNLFRADHPFIFIIQERATGNILFMGRVIDPTAK